MANPAGHDEVDEGTRSLSGALATTTAGPAMVTATATADETREADEEEITEPKMSYHWTYWYARFTVLNEYEDLPCPVETQGAHLISAPPSPKAVAPRHDPSSFCKDLLGRLRRLATQQSLRVTMYGKEFADEWPISRTPRPLAEEIREARIKARDALLHLDSPSSSEDPEYEPAWLRRLKEARAKRRQARAQAKAEAKAQAEANAKLETKAETEADAEAGLQIPARSQPQPRTPQLSPRDDAGVKSEQPIIHAMADQSCKKRKAPPTPISPSPKRVRV